MTSFIPRISTVKGVSDQRRLPRAGIIHLGIKKVTSTGKEYPSETDYFVAPPEVQRVFGDKPKSLTIRFPVDEPRVIFPQSLIYYGKSKGKKCTGDKEVAYRHKDICAGDCLNHNTDELWHERACPCEKLRSDKNPKGECTLRGHLLFMLTDVTMGGVYQCSTGSYNSIVDINSGIAYVQELIMLATEGASKRFAMLPLTLERVPRKTGGGESGVQQTHYTLKLTCNLTLEQLAEFRKDPGMIQLAKSSLALPEPLDENPTMDETGVIEHDQKPPNGAAQQEAPPLPADPPPDDGAPPFIPPEEQQPEGPREPEGQEEPATKNQIEQIYTQLKKKKIVDVGPFKERFSFTPANTPKSMVNDVLSWIRNQGEKNGK